MPDHVHAALSRFLSEVDHAAVKHLGKKPSTDAGLHIKSPNDDQTVPGNDDLSLAPHSDKPAVDAGLHIKHSDASAGAKPPGESVTGDPPEPDEDDLPEHALRDADGNVEDPVAAMMKRMSPKSKEGSVELESVGGKPKPGAKPKFPLKPSRRR